MDTNSNTHGDGGDLVARPEAGPTRMLTAEARVATERASRYLVQLCKHAAAMGTAGGHGPRMHLHGLLARRQVRVDADWSESSGTVSFDPWGRCVVTADTTALVLRVEAADEDSLRRIQDVIARDLARFGRRDQLDVNWGRIGV